MGAVTRRFRPPADGLRARGQARRTRLQPVPHGQERFAGRAETDSHKRSSAHLSRSLAAMYDVPRRRTPRAARSGLRALPRIPKLEARRRIRPWENALPAYRLTRKGSVRGLPPDADARGQAV